MVSVQQFQLSYIRETTNTLHANLVNMCSDVNYML